jgi:cAMP-dependent protein kinase regulator
MTGAGVRADILQRHKLAERLAGEGRKEEAADEYLHLLKMHRGAGELLEAIAAGKAALALDPGNEAAARLVGQLDELQPEDFPPTPILSSLPREAFAALVRRLELRFFPEGQTIVTEGASGTSLFLVARGRVNVQHEGTALATIGNGAVFGEMAVLADVPRLATVVAADDTLLLELDRQVVKELAGEHPRVIVAVERFYRERLLANLLHVNDLFDDIPADARRAVVERFAVRTAKPGEDLLTEGVVGDGMYVILRGRCGVSWRAGETVERAPELHEGDVFGEITLLSAGDVTATVTARTACVLLHLSVPDFRELLLPIESVRNTLNRLGNERLSRSRKQPTTVSLDDYLV